MYRVAAAARFARSWARASRRSPWRPGRRALVDPVVPGV